MCTMSGFGGYNADRKVMDDSLTVAMMFLYRTVVYVLVVWLK